LSACGRLLLRRHRGQAAAADGVEMMSELGEACVNSLFDLEPPGHWKRLGEEKLVTLCSKVMSAGTDTSATALE
jgi:hypothetical protein